MKFLRWVGITIVIAAIALGVAVMGARMGDGPTGMLPGGELVAGEWTEGPEPDWSFVREIGEIDFQLVEPEQSRRTWILEHQGAIYIPCGFPNFTVWKKWPHQAIADGRSVIRVEGRLYARQAVKIDDADLHGALQARLAEKYELPENAPSTQDTLWFFRMDPRSS